MKSLMFATAALGIVLGAAGKVEFSAGKFSVGDKNAAYLKSGEHGAWLIKFEGGKQLSAAKAVKDAALRGDFSERGTSAGKVSRWRTMMADVEVFTKTLPDGSLEASAKVTPKTGIVTEMFFPARLEFEAKDVKRFVYPGRGNETMGLAFNSKFFSARRSYRVPYPPLFADWARLETVAGASVQIWGVQKRGGFEPWKNPNPFVPGFACTGADGKGKGYYDHSYAMFAKKGETASTPRIRIAEGGDIDSALAVYMRENGLGRSLKEKCAVHPDPKFLEKMAASPMFLMFGKCTEVSRATERLPVPTMVHLHAYMKHGFDKGYPDFLPPRPGFGTIEEMKELVAKVKAQGNLFCPYTNPCWWGDEPGSQTFIEAGMDPIVLKRDGKPQTLVYGPNKGFNVTYFHPAVQAANRKTRDVFRKDFGIDIMFQDQCGSLPWFWDFNPASPSPTAHTEGMISIVEEDSRLMPLSTEDGWDMVADNEVGLTGCAWKTIPLEEMNRRTLFKQGSFPADTYVLEPVAARMFRDKLMFYHHDLAGFTTNERVLAWVLALGYNVVVAYRATQMEDDPWTIPWYGWLHAIQSKVLAKTVGGKVEFFEHDRRPLLERNIDPAVPYDDGVVRAVYGGIRFLVNLGDIPRVVDGKKLAPYGWWIEGKGVRAGKLEGGVPFIDADGTRTEFTATTGNYVINPRYPGGKVAASDGKIEFKWYAEDRKSRATDYFKVTVKDRKTGKIVAEKKTDLKETVARATTIGGLASGVKYEYLIEAFAVGGAAIGEAKGKFSVE